MFLNKNELKNKRIKNYTTRLKKTPHRVIHKIFTNFYIISLFVFLIFHPLFQDICFILEETKLFSEE